MIQYSHSDIKRLIVCGDVHGEFKEFFHKIRINAVDKMSFEDIPLEQVIDDKEVLEKLKTHLEDLPSHIKEEIECYKRGSRSHGLQEMKDCVIIVAGDCGFGFNKEGYYHQIFNKYIPLLEQNNIFIYFVRGNHDDSSYFEEQKINYERIKTVPDYSVIKIDNKNILCVGGAISIDRTWRKQKEFVINKHKKEHKKKLYWKDEAPIYSQEKLEEICENGIIINGIISHTNPHFAYPTSKNGVKNWARVDKELHNDVNNERHTLTNIYDFFKGKKMNLDFWCYGHHHVHNTQNYEKTTMYAINEMQFKQIQLTEEKKDSFFSTIDWSLLSNTIAERPIQEIPRRQDGFVADVGDIFFEPNQENVEEQNEQPQPLHFGEGLEGHLERLRVDLAQLREMNRNLEPVRIDDTVEERINNEIDTLINNELF
jgi:predicted phosphodiesterase